MCSSTGPKNNNYRDFPGGSAAKISPSNAGGAGLLPGLGAENPHASQPEKEKQQQQQQKKQHKIEAIL